MLSALHQLQRANANAHRGDTSVAARDDAVFAYIAAGVNTPAQLLQRINCSNVTMHHTLRRLIAQGRIERHKPGQYRPKESTK